MEKEQDNLYKIRHTLAHILAKTVLEIDPGAKLAIGPPVSDGFYYDFELSDGVKIGDVELKNIQKRMRKIVQKGFTPELKTLSEDEARELFAKQPYKLELIDAITKDGEDITTYEIADFIDLCEGPHVSTSDEIDQRAFKLAKVAGAYWRGDESNTMLTRIYAYAFAKPAELDAHLELLEEAKRRDHRKLGQELDLFTFSDLVGPGLPLWTPKGTLMRELIVDRITNIQKRFGYKSVTIPHITKSDLYKTSGHWEKFGDELFKVKGKSDAEFVMKPMNCPHHTQIFSSSPKSYRDLPIRYAETTMVYRDEQAGELLGLSRVRSITQDDGHVFCTTEQVEQEVNNIISVIKHFYSSLDMFAEGKFWVSVSVRDPETPDKYLGDTNNWDIAEKTLENIVKDNGFKYKVVPGEAAFYGPKIDFMFFDALGRERQLATAQLDFVMPSRFGLEYTDKTGNKQTPVMIHRAIAGSLERFLAIIIEHFAGNFPTWLSPEQVRIVPVADAHSEYAHRVLAGLEEFNIRASIHEATDSLGKRIRVAKKEKIPYTLVLGDKEQETGSVTAEVRDGDKLELSLNDFVERVVQEITDKS
jgi:threonyl-tRNA synthetase